MTTAVESNSIAAITKSLPPATDYITYLTVLESHLSPEVLPTLNTILQDAELTQNIGWDLVHLLLPIPGGEKCLNTIARLGNPREVILKVTEALQILDLDSAEVVEEAVPLAPPTSAEPKEVDKFCLLVNLLSILHPRIKTKYPSRFLSTSLIAILSAYRPSNQATLAILSFVRTISGKKRPPLPGRQSSLKIPITDAVVAESDKSAPDPEAQEEEPQEAAIQRKLLQSFVTHVLEEYVNSNTLEWAARLLESFQPGKVVTGKKSLGEAFKDEPLLATRDDIAGQLVALLRDLGLSGYSVLFETIHKTDSPPSDNDDEENYPSSPSDVPLSRAGCLFLISSFIFSSVIFGSTTPLPSIAIFPDHARLVKQFVQTEHPELIGKEPSGVVDALLAVGLWLENSNKFVSGPLEDEDFLQHLQSLSLLSANNPSPSLRYAAHVLVSSILHAHPVDRLRLTFISDTLEDCPFESLKASAVTWLKEEIITASERKSENIFSSTAALAAAQPYLFPDITELAGASDGELIQALAESYPFNMAVSNFLYFIGGKGYEHVVPSGMTSVVEEIYLGPLRNAQARALASLGQGKEVDVVDGMVSELQLLGESIALASSHSDHAA